MTAARCTSTESTSTAKQAEVDAYVHRLVDAAPPLTPEQRDRLAVLLRGAV